ncbi:MAG: hypothetical protein JXB04_00820 [Kiritimatiellae bacterium]|nr:hypothetical protein [Kiritimatiellia bacterium]
MSANHSIVKVLFFALVGAVAVAVRAYSAVLYNPGFEETTSLSGWSTFGGSVWDSWYWSGNPLDAHSGSGSAAFKVIGGDGEGYAGLYQNLPAIGGHSYTGGVWLRAIGLDDGVSESYFELQFFDASGAVIGQAQSPVVSANQSPHAFMSAMGVAPANAVTVSVRGIVHILSTQPADTYDFHLFDDFVFQDLDEEAVPEPAASSFLATGLLAVLALRRLGSSGGSRAHYG